MQDKDRKFLFIRIPKTASTTLRSAILGESFLENRGGIVMYRGSRPAQQAPIQLRVKNKNKYISLLGLPEDAEVLPTHASYEEWRGLNLESEKYLKFSFVRNPWDWMASQYAFLIQVYLKRIKNMFAGRPSSKRNLTSNRRNFSQILGNFDLTIDDFRSSPADLTFERYVYGYFKKDDLIKSQSDFLKGADDEISMDFIGKFESLQSDWDILAQKLEIPKRQLEKTNVSVNKGDYKKYYSSRVVKKMVEEGLGEDIENFGYGFEK